MKKKTPAKLESKTTILNILNQIVFTLLMLHFFNIMLTSMEFLIYGIYKATTYCHQNLLQSRKQAKI